MSSGEIVIRGYNGDQSATGPAAPHCRAQARGQAPIATPGSLFLIKDHLNQIAHLTIDREFDGRDGDVKGLLLLHIYKIVPDFPKEQQAHQH